MFIFEMATNVVQGVIFALFCYKFLTPKFSKIKNILCCVINILLMFTTITLLNFYYEMFAKVETPLFIGIMMLYSVFCFKDKIFTKILIPIIEYIVLSCSSVLYQAIFSIVLKEKTTFIALNEDNFYRVLCCVLSNITIIFIFWIIYKLHNKSINLKDAKEVIVFIVFPLVSLFVIVLLTFAYYDPSTSQSNSVIIAIVMGLMIVLTVLILVVLSKISTLNEIYIQNIMMKNKQKMYKNEIDNSNRYIKEISKIKHDINNEIYSIRELLYNNNIKQAISVCDGVVDKLDSVASVMNTNNVYLNSIMNVVLKKASESNIKVKLQITNELEEIEGNDIIVMLGNLCDNAIEYLSDKLERNMEIVINKKGSFNFIYISNTIENSVLKNNPNLVSIKNDSMHGYGIKNVKDVVSKYNGKMNFEEHNGIFIANVMLISPTVTQ